MRIVGTALLVFTLTSCGGDVLDESAFERPAATAAPPASSSATTQPQRPRVTARPAPEVAEVPSDLPTVPRRLVEPRRLGMVEGADVSWPQCPPGMGIPEKRSHGGPMPLPSAKYVVIGLTNGPSFTPNPCLADQVAWVRERGLLAGAYAVHSRPDAETVERLGDEGPYDGSTRLGALRNVGFQQARYAVAQMRSAGLPSPYVWIDVEPVPDFEWGDDLEANAAVFEGAARGYQDSGVRIGAYSTPLLWQAVVGDFTFGGVPEWRAAGQTSRAEALRRCEDDWSFQGGEAVMGQWVQYDRDCNVTCPGAKGRLTDYFVRP